jgi:DNA modification methylase
LREKQRFIIAPNGQDTSISHPTVKPLAVMTKIIGNVGGDTVLDPFMGSGTTGVACVKRGKRFIGIERHEPYFNIACDRIRKAYAQPDMFASTSKPKEPKQEALL